jgi:hypothetical protein
MKADPLCRPQSIAWQLLDVNCVDGKWDEYKGRVDLEIQIRGDWVQGKWSEGGKWVVESFLGDRELETVIGH